MKLLGRLFIVLGILALIPGGLTIARDTRQAGQHDAKIAQLDADRDSIMKELHDLNIEYRGYQQSVPTIPDSIKKAQSGIISNTYKEYNKRIRVLEMDQQEMKRLMGREETRKAEVMADTWTVGGGLAGGVCSCWYSDC